MSKVPEDRPAESLEELTDEDIVAQQAAAHTPQPRAKVEVESQTIVIQQEVVDESQRELSPYTAASTDSTVVVRDQRESRPNRGRPRMSGPALALWIGLGAAAFGIGGAVALIGGPSGETSGKGVSSQATATAARPSDSKQTIAPVSGKRQAAEPPEAAASVPALSPSQLPPIRARRKRPPVRAKKRASHPLPSPAPPRGTTPPEKSGIPSRI